MWLPKSFVCLFAKMADSQYRVGRGVQLKSFKYNSFPKNTHAYVWCQDKTDCISNIFLRFYAELEEMQGHFKLESKLNIKNKPSTLSVCIVYVPGRGRRNKTILDHSLRTLLEFLFLALSFFFFSGR